jgi:hypothetical protein
VLKLRRSNTIDPVTFKLLISLAIIVIATLHGYGAAWLAIWMLFHPYQPLKLLGITIWPQGMIPRHRARLAQSIGNAVGNELVSQETIFQALFETGFFSSKVEGFVNSYTRELLSTVYPSLIEALPAGARAGAGYDCRAAIPPGGTHRVGFEEPANRGGNRTVCRSPG